MDYLIIAAIAFVTGWTFRAVGAAYQDAKAARALNAGSEKLREASAQMREANTVLVEVRKRLSDRNP